MLQFMFSFVCRACCFIDVLDPAHAHNWELFSIGTATAKLPTIKNDSLTVSLLRGGILTNMMGNVQNVQQIAHAKMLMEQRFGPGSFHRVNHEPKKSLALDAGGKKSVSKMMGWADEQVSALVLSCSRVLACVLVLAMLLLRAAFIADDLVFDVCFTMYTCFEGFRPLLVVQQGGLPHPRVHRGRI